MRFDEITLSTLLDKLGHFDGLAAMWSKFTRLKFLWRQYKNDGRIGPLLQCQCDDLASVLEHVSAAPEPSKVFQAMLDEVVEQAAQLAGNSQSSASVNSMMEDGDAFTTPNMSPSPGVAKTLEWTPTTDVSRGPQNRQSNSENTRRRKSDQGKCIERNSGGENLTREILSSAELVTKSLP